MNLSSPNRSVMKPKRRVPLEFSPTFASIALSKVFQSFDATAGGDDLDIGDIADDFKHRTDRGVTRVADSVDAHQPR